MLLREFASIARRRWYWILVVGVAFGGSFETWFRYLRPNSCHAVSVLTVRDEVLAGGRGVLDASGLETELTSFELLRLAARLLRGDADWPDAGLLPGDFSTTLEETRARFPSGDAAEQKIAESLQERLEWETDSERGKYFVLVRGRIPAEALVSSCAVAQAARMHSEEVLKARTAKTLSDLRDREKNLKKEWETSTTERVKNSKKFGIADVSRREDLVRKLILDAEEEIYRIGALKIELWHRIQNREATDEFEKVEKQEGATGGGARALEEELAQTRLEYESRVAVLPEQHPRLVQLKERIWQLESLLSSSDEEQAKTDSTTPDDLKRLTEQYRSLALRIETIEKRREHLFAEVLRLQEVRPTVQLFEANAQRAVDSLTSVRGTIDNLARTLSSAVSPVAVERFASSSKTDRLPGEDWMWRAGVILAGLLAGFVVAWGRDRLDPYLRTDRDVDRLLELPLMAVLPKMSGRERRQIDHEPRNKCLERFNAAATIVTTVGQEFGMRTFVVASAKRHEGRTTTSVHVASALARQGLRVAVVDCDLRRPAVHKALRLDNDSGLTNLLIREEATQEIVEGQFGLELLDEETEAFGVVEVLRETSLRNLFAVTAGPAIDSPVAAAELPQFRRVLAELTEILDYVILDTPPVLEAGEALSLARAADGTLFVVGAGRCRTGDALWTKHLLENVQATVVGVVLNGSSSKAMSGPLPRLQQSLRQRENVGV